MFKAWKITIQVGMAAWAELQRFRKKRKTEVHSAMEHRFMTIWCQGDLFCRNDNDAPRWHPAPSLHSLPREYSRHLSSTRIDRNTNEGAKATPASPPQSDLDVDSTISPPPSPCFWALNPTPFNTRNDDIRPALMGHDTRQAKVDNLAASILRQILQDVTNDAAEESAFSLPHDLQSSDELLAQAAFWTSQPK